MQQAQHLEWFLVLTVMVLVHQLKDSVADFGRRHVDFAPLELDLVNNL